MRINAKIKDILANKITLANVEIYVFQIDPCLD